MASVGDMSAELKFAILIKFSPFVNVVDSVNTEWAADTVPCVSI